MSQDLSKNLKNELFYVINSKVIKEMIWLEKFFSDALINMLIYQIKDLHLDPETDIEGV